MPPSLHVEGTSGANEFGWSKPGSCGTGAGLESASGLRHPAAPRHSWRGSSQPQPAEEAAVEARGYTLDPTMTDPKAAPADAKFAAQALLAGAHHMTFWLS